MFVKVFLLNFEFVRFPNVVMVTYTDVLSFCTFKKIVKSTDIPFVSLVKVFNPFVAFLQKLRKQKGRG